MSRLVIVVEKPSDWGAFYPSDNVVAAADYLRGDVGAEGERTQVINLCRSYKYMGTGYYFNNYTRNNELCLYTCCWSVR